MSVEEDLKSFVNQINRMNAKEGKRWVDLNNLSNKYWPSLEKSKIIRVYHPSIEDEDIPVYWTWTQKGDKLIKELDLKAEDPAFWITGELEKLSRMAEKEELKKLAQELDDTRIQNEAQEIASWIESAVGDMAYEQHRMWEEGWVEPETKQHLDRLKAEGVIDIPGRYADDLYNDASLLRDLLGDRVYDAGQTNEERLAIVAALKKLRSFTAWQTALEGLENSLKERS